MSQPGTELRFYHLDLTACEHGPDPARLAASVTIGGAPYEIPAKCGAGRDIGYWTCTQRVAADLMPAHAPAYLDIA